MAELHRHYCKRCDQTYDCTEDRPIDSSLRGGPADSVCFHHYGVPHKACTPEGEHTKRVVVGGE